MKLIFKGLILFLIGVAGWFISVIMSVVTLGKFAGLANLFGAVAVVGLAMTIIFAIINLFKRINKH